MVNMSSIISQISAYSQASFTSLGLCPRYRITRSGSTSSELTAATVVLGMKNGKFTLSPLLKSTTFNRLSKIVTLDFLGETYTMPNFVQIRPRGFYEIWLTKMQ